MFSDEARVRITLSGKKDFQIAYLSDTTPVVFSKIKNGIIQVTPDDPRLVRIAKVIGLPPERCVKGNALSGSLASTALMADR